MSADKEQVGGGHYKEAGEDMQHWNVSAAHGWDGLTHTVTKYLFRWPNKNGVEDLKKARHTLDKMIEMAERGWKPKWDPNPLWRSEPFNPANPKPQGAERISTFKDFLFEGMKGDVTEYTCKKCKEKVHVANYTDPTLQHLCPAEPGKGYVNQDNLPPPFHNQ